MTTRRTSTGQQVNVRMDPEAAETLRLASATSGQSVSFIVQAAVSNWLNSNPHFDYHAAISTNALYSSSVGSFTNTVATTYQNAIEQLGG